MGMDAYRIEQLEGSPDIRLTLSWFQVSCVGNSILLKL